MSELATADHEHAANRGEFECAKCVEHIRQNEALLTDLQSAETALRTERRKVGKLRAELAKQTAEDPQIDLANVIFRLWNDRVKAGRAREFKGKRQENVVARLNGGATLTDFKWAIYGAEKRPNSRNGVVFNDLELIARDDSNLQSFIDRGMAARAEELAAGDAV